MKWTSCSAFLPGTHKHGHDASPATVLRHASANRMHEAIFSVRSETERKERRKKTKMKRSHWVRFRCMLANRALGMCLCRWTRHSIDSMCKFPQHAHTQRHRRAHTHANHDAVSRARISQAFANYTFCWWYACPLRLSTVEHSIQTHSSAARWLPDSIRSVFPSSSSFLSILLLSTSFLALPICDALQMSRARSLFSFLIYFFFW